MKLRQHFALLSLVMITSSLSAHAAEPADPFRWLEAIDSSRSLDWVKAHNAVTTERFEQAPGFAELRTQLGEILNSQTRIPYVVRMGDFYYNFWRDAEHPRGIYRRTTPAEYQQAAPQWETVLDLDALAQQEKENWVWKGASCRPHTWDRCLLLLSRGGGDAVVVREFDLSHKAFAADGFSLPEAKSSVSWQGPDAIFVGTDFGPGSLTDSGYPRVFKLWQRGTPLTQAQTVIEGAASDVSVSASVAEHQGVRHEIVRRETSFYTAKHFIREGSNLIPIDLPDDVGIDFFGPQMLVTLRKDYRLADGTQYPAGSLLATDFAAFQTGQRVFQVLFQPTPDTALTHTLATRSHLILSILDKVKGRLQALSFQDGRWTAPHAVPAPSFGSLGIMAESAADDSDRYFLNVTDFLTPDTLYLMNAADDSRATLKQRPAFFKAEGLEIVQYETKSKDGTQVPYFVVKPKDMKFDASHPTLLYGYGGFQISLTPSYSAGIGKGWLEKGGVYVLANIRGGGEFGPRWHDAALKEHRQRAYDDFMAVAQDLVQRKITQPSKLGIMGGSNGGLLMGVMLTQRPDLFGAVVCQVPLLDMRRFNKLLAGASWMAEYGNPDEAKDWAYIQRYSPYQNVHKGKRYPKVLFTTSTRDDRVHPGHARKMMAKMESLGVKHLWYYENTEGGHAGAANNLQTAYMNALAYTFLWQTLSTPSATQVTQVQQGGQAQ